MARRREPLYVDRTDAGTNLADALAEENPVNPALAIELRAHSIANLAELRKTRGSNDGNSGPRACLLAGQLTPLDAGAGIFVWDSTSTLADNGLSTASAFTVAQVFGVATGRWRRLVISGGSGITQLTGDGTAGPGSGSQALTLASVIAGGSFGSTTQVGTFTVDVKGRLTAAANVSIASSVAINQLTGDVTAGPGSGSVAATLKNIPDTTPMAGDVVAVSKTFASVTAPAAGSVALFSDSTALTFRTKNSFGVSSSMAFNQAAVASQWLNSFSAVTGVFSQAQPAFTDISGTATAAQIPDVIIGVQILSSGTTYTATAGTKSQIVEGWGGGGGGGGTLVSAAGTGGMGGGGGSGGYFMRKYAILGGNTGTIVIGAAGAAGANTGAVAGNGGNTTFTDGTTLCTANGGVGAPAQIAVAAGLAIGLGGAGAAISTNGSVNTKGIAGGSGFRVAPGTSPNGGQGGAGAATFLGGEGAARNSNGAGNAATANTGSGGGGGLSLNGGAAVAGGAGGTGLIVVREFA